jgi:hypothetical protein
MYLANPEQDLPIQIQSNKDSFKFSFFCRTIKDWNKLPEHITNSSGYTEIFRERLTHDVLLKTFIKHRTDRESMLIMRKTKIKYP